MSKPFAITLEPGSSLANHTGSWRVERPVYVKRLPPCNHKCAAGEDIQGWLYFAESGDYETAWRSLVRNNPFPAIMGRVCYHPCEDSCNRGQLDQAVNIHAVERFLGDEAIRRGWQFKVAAPATGKRVLIIGAGPSGLAVAYHLALAGHNVTLRDSAAQAGGMMRYGIPKYRLPREVLDAEIARIVALGIDLQLNSPVENLAGTLSEGGYDAVFLAIGAHLAKRAYIPAGDASRIVDAVGMLRGMESGEKPQLGRRVIIYGGGNTAIDAARTAKRLGASEAVIVYRRTREMMPAHDAEVMEALEEGVQFRWLSTIKAAAGSEIQVEKMELDATGFPQPTGKFETIPADSVVLALGQEANYKFLEGLDGLEFVDKVLQVNDQMMTGHPGVFAGGDMVPSERTVTVAAGHGKKAARCIDSYLRGEVYQPAPKNAVATFDKLNTWYYSDAPKTVQPLLDAVRRQTTFDEVQGGLDETNALFEARRCLSCGNCFHCDNCFGMCPDNAVRKLVDDDGTIDLSFNYEYCKGCGLCASECPCGSIEMAVEPS